MAGIMTNNTALRSALEKLRQHAAGGTAKFEDIFNEVGATAEGAAELRKKHYCQLREDYLDKFHPSWREEPLSSKVPWYDETVPQPTQTQVRESARNRTILFYPTKESKDCFPVTEEALAQLFSVQQSQTGSI
jgi:hypothetical protein